MSLRLTAAAATLSLAACGPAEGPGSAEAERALRAANAAYDRAIVGADRAALDRILAPDYVYITAQGEVRDRATTIARHTAGGVRIDSQGSDDLRIRWLGDAALLTGRFRARITMGGRSFPIEERYSSIWTRDGTSWRLRHEHASEVPRRE